PGRIDFGQIVVDRAPKADIDQGLTAPGCRIVRIANISERDAQAEMPACARRWVLRPRRPAEAKGHGGRGAPQKDLATVRLEIENSFHFLPLLRGLRHALMVASHFFNGAADGGEALRRPA